MINHIPSEKRGHTNIEWLDSKHSFSFGEYYDENNMAFHSLRVINEDVIAPGQGFSSHPHRNMEIVTFVLSGALEHKDSLGSGSVIRPGTIQKMTAGKGILHSEFNHSEDEPVHLLQIWITPDKTGLPPSYEEADFNFENGIALLAAPKGQNGAVTLNQDAKIYSIGLTNSATRKIDLDVSRKYWIQITKGSVNVNKTLLKQGDALTLETEKELVLVGAPEADILLFDLA